MEWLFHLITVFVMFKFDKPIIVIIMTNFGNDVIISPHSGAYHCGECETCPREDK